MVCLNMIENLNFLNNCLDIPTKFIKIFQQDVHQSDDMFGWQGLASLTCLNETGDIYDIDIRYAWSEKVFRQNLVDYGWSEAILIDGKGYKKQNRHKLIVYLCEPSTKLDKKQKLETNLDHHLIGCYWKTLSHIYILLPCEHPFEDKIHRNQKSNFEQSSIVNYEYVIQNSENSQIKTVSRLPVKTGRKGEGGLRTQGKYKISTENTPLISVVTVVFNGEQFLEQTIQSVINQSYSNIEYIVIDGASTDKTLDIIRQYEEYIDYWVSETDINLYDAMNKGIKCALGKFINFMNTGDLFFNHQVIKSLDFHNKNTSLCGDNVFFSNLQPGLIYGPKKELGIPHQSLFMIRHDFEIYIFNTEYKYCADAELWTRFNFKLSNIESIDSIVSLSRLSGVSTNKKYLIPRTKETLKFQQNKFKVLLRLIPKIILSIFLNRKDIERIYFSSRRKIIK